VGGRSRQGGVRRCQELSPRTPKWSAKVTFRKRDDQLSLYPSSFTRYFVSAWRKLRSRWATTSAAVSLTACSSAGGL